MTKIIHKTVAHETKKTDEGVEYVLSDATSDRYGDVIEASGWALKEFKNNPIALFNHNPDFPIGKWVNVRITNGKLVGTLKMAPRGTSARIDELLNLVDADILRGVSVGFLPIEHEQLGKHGTRYTKSNLVECSLVSIPANPNALATAKSLGVSTETLDAVFDKNVRKDGTHLTRSLTGKNAEKSDKSLSSGKQPMSLAARIAELQTKTVALQDQIETMTAEENFDETVMTTLSDELETGKKTLAALQRAEVALASKTVVKPVKTNDDDNNDRGTVDRDVILPVRMEKLFAVPESRKIKPLDILVKAVAMDIKHYGEGRKRSIVDVVKQEYNGADNDMSRSVLAVMQRFGITKAATIPADTTTSGWADTLVQTVIGDFIEALIPYSIYPQLRARGGSFTFGRNGAITLPGRNPSTTLAGAFVAQGAPIPVRQGAFTPITLTPKKMGVITTMTREITEHSTPQIEAILKQAMLEDTGVAIDTILLDATASSTTRPAGLKNGISKISVSATASIVGFVADIKTLYAALITATNGNVRSPVWIMNPGDVLAASLLQTTVGETPFREELARGTLLGIPVVTSTTGLSDMMGIIDAADFLTATGDTPQFSVSDQAVLHMEDTTPLAIATVATPNSVAAPVRSLWQTDSLAIRMIMDINWTKRRAGIFQWADTMVWN